MQHHRSSTHPAHWKSMITLIYDCEFVRPAHVRWKVITLIYDGYLVRQSPMSDRKQGVAQLIGNPRPTFSIQEPNPWYSARKSGSYTSGDQVSYHRSRYYLCRNGTLWLDKRNKNCGEWFFSLFFPLYFFHVPTLAHLHLMPHSPMEVNLAWPQYSAVLDMSHLSWSGGLYRHIHA